MVEKNEPIRSKEASPTGPDTGTLRTGGGDYEIRVKGQLDSSWSDWLEGLEVKLLENGEMVLYGPIVDQSALMGVLNKLYRLNLVLKSVKEANKKDDQEEK